MPAIALTTGARGVVPAAAKRCNLSASAGERVWAMTDATFNSDVQAPAAVTLHERERAFEAKYAHDEELKFLALARRDKLFALWLVGQLGLSGAQLQAFLHEILAVQGFPQHDAALLRFAAGALQVAGIVADAPAALARLGAEAREQLMHGTATPIDLFGEHPA